MLTKVIEIHEESITISITKSIISNGPLNTHDHSERIVIHRAVLVRGFASCVRQKFSVEGEENVSLLHEKFYLFYLIISGKITYLVFNTTFGWKSQCVVSACGIIFKTFKYSKRFNDCQRTEIY